MKTGKDKTIAGLKALGYKLDTTARTSKYLVYRRDDHTWIVGRAGGLRSIRGNGPITSSVSRTGLFRPSGGGLFWVIGPCRPWPVVVTCGRSCQTRTRP